VTEARLAALLPEGADLEGCLGRLAAFWEGRGAMFSRAGGEVSLAGRADLLPPEGAVTGRKLSEGAVATLATIAIHQPISVPQIEAVRGVKLARGIVESLERAGLAEVADRRRGTGRAKLYATTDLFLESIGLDALSDLPTPEEILHLDIVDPDPVSAAGSG